MKQKQGGFTLIELLIIVAIIGILVTIIFSDIYKSRRAAVVSTFKTQISSLMTSAIEVCDYAAMSNGMSVRNAIDAKNGGSLPVGMQWYVPSVEDVHCGSNGNKTFKLYVDSQKMEPPCRATIRHTGVAEFDGC